jgi:N-acyl-D-amino-acid deacylase
LRVGSSVKAYFALNLTATAPEPILHTKSEYAISGAAGDRGSNMAGTLDLALRGGTILDGSGAAPFKADIGISNGLIEEIGVLQGNALQEIDATGMLITPGFVDVHTHFDGQVTWENRLSPSSDHGVTTVIMGNCGVGFAPCKPQERTMLLKVMEGVEDIPEIVMSQGIPWRWETFPEYLDFLSGRQFDVDCAAHLPHSALRIFVMGARGAAGEPSTAEDRKRMTELVTEAVNAGAIGVSSSRALLHRDVDGNLAPHVRSGRLELLALAQGLRNAGHGVFQLAAGLSSQQLKDFVTEAGQLSPKEHVRQEIELLCEIADTAGRPLSFALTDLHEAPGMYRQVLNLLAANNKTNMAVRAQIFPRPIGLLFGLDLSLNPFKLHPSYRAIEALPLADRVARMRTPEVRRQLLAEKPDPNFPNPVLQFLVSRSLDAYLSHGDIDYDPDPTKSLAAEAVRREISIWEAAYDALLEDDGKSILFLPMNNFTNNNLDNIHDMLTHADTLIGLGDGGAHYGLICDASFPTFMLTYWTRDREGPRLGLPAAINMMTRRNALAVGLEDRGLIARGLKADINVIDYDRLHLQRPEVVYDLPAGGRRVIQRATGYRATIVSGQVTYRDGTATGALPGRVVRPENGSGHRGVSQSGKPFGSCTGIFAAFGNG